MATDKQPDTCRLTVTIKGVHYLCRPVRKPAAGVARAWLLLKADGTRYTVADGQDGQTCDCGSFIFRHEGKDATGCKHVRALRALGLIDGDGEGPHDWPPWTDFVAVTVTRR